MFVIQKIKEHDTINKKRYGVNEFVTLQWKQICKDTKKAIGNFLSLFRPKKKGGWIDANNDGLKTRFEVLFRDALYCTIRKNKKGKITIDGKWKCKYTGKIFTDHTHVDIDHIVPRKYAKDNKIGLWTQSDYILFENDPENLVAVWKKENNRKGAKAPPQYLPQQNTEWYVHTFVYVCEKWKIKLPPTKKTS